MRTVRQKAFAKINLFLDIVGEKDGYHMLDTIVTTISLFDEVILTRRGDDKIVLKTQGSLYSISESYDNNVYKAAALFRDTYGTRGVDVTLHKNVPISSGLGGSSADIAGTLIGMKKLFGVEKADIKALADSLGSDSGYLTVGGYARLSGRGEIVEKLPIDKQLFLVIACAKGGVNTRECYLTFDSLEKPVEKPKADDMIERLKKGEVCGEDFFNALYAPAAVVNPNVATVYEAMKALSPRAVSMSGSGSGIFGIFDTKQLCEWAAEKMKKITKDVFIAETTDSDEEKKGWFFSRSLYSID